MTNSYQPQDRPAPDPVEAWVRFTRQWDAAYKAYLAAREARADDEAVSCAPNPGLLAEEERALAALAEIKSEMDRLVGETRQRRSPLGGTIVVGTISADDEGAPEAGEAPSSSQATS